MKRLLGSKPFMVLVILGLTTFVAWADWMTGAELSLFAVYFVPVGLAGWHLGLAGAIGESLVCATFWFGAESLAGHHHASHGLAIANTLIRTCAFMSVGLGTQRIRQLLLAERASADLLRQTLAEVSVLRGILPICSVCKKIRDDDGHWVVVERYITTHSGASFTHGYCPACAKSMLVEAGLEDTDVG